MTISVGDPFEAFTYKNHITGSHSIEDIYFATFVEPIIYIRIDPEYHSEYDWLAKNELDKVTDTNKTIEDIEIQVIKKGFALLEGMKLRLNQ